MAVYQGSAQGRSGVHCRGSNVAEKVAMFNQLHEGSRQQVSWKQKVEEKTQNGKQPSEGSLVEVSRYVRMYNRQMSITDYENDKIKEAASRGKRLPMTFLALGVLVRKFGFLAAMALSFFVESNQPFNACQLFITTAWNNTRRALFWLSAEPLWRCLQAIHVIKPGECTKCSPLGRLSVVGHNQSGSSMEGHDDLDAYEERPCASDVDVMLELGPCRWLRADDQDGPPISVDPAASPDCGGDSSPLLVATPTSKPGFVLLYVEPTSECKHSDWRIFSAEALRSLVLDWCRIRYNTDFSIEPSGPAVNVRKTGIDTNGGTDWVSCFHLPVWPSEEFRTRPRVTDFPPAEAREDICRFGVHLVPTGHPGSPTEHIELRLSFSRAEVVAAWHLFPTVRIAIHGLKNVRNEMKKRRKKTAVKETKKHLKSYHIKTTALWLCQDVPRESWTSATTAMYMILDKLEEAVGERTLHCFFWTEINLFSEFSAEDLDAMRLQIQKIRKILLTGLMGWFDKCFDLQSWADRDMSSIEGICQQSPEDRVSQPTSQRQSGRPTQSSVETHSDPATRSSKMFSTDSRGTSSVKELPITGRQLTSDKRQPNSENQLAIQSNAQTTSVNQQLSSASQQTSSGKRQALQGDKQSSSLKERLSPCSQSSSSSSSASSRDSPLNEQHRVASVRRLQLFAARHMVIYSVMEGIRHRHMGSSGVDNDADISDHIREELMRFRVGQPYAMGRMLVQAMLAAPEDLVGSARLVGHGGDVYTWDVAPLLALLNDSDMQLLLGEPEAVASWWRQQLRLPRAERPQGMTADLDTPQGRKELLLNSNLLLRALEETGVLSSTSHQCPKQEPLEHRKRSSLPFSSSQPPLSEPSQTLQTSAEPIRKTPCSTGETRHMKEPIWKTELEKWDNFARASSWHVRSYERIRQELDDAHRSNLESRLGRSAIIRGSQNATAAARLWRRGIERMLSGSELRTKYEAITGALPDRWQLRQYVFDDC